MDCIDWQQVPAPSGLLYEGVRWLPNPGVFQWVDILGHGICRWNPYAGKMAERRDLPLEFTSVALPISPSRSVVAARSTVHIYDWDTGALSPLASIAIDDDLRFNDGGISPEGELFIGTMSMTGRSGVASLYHIGRNGDVTQTLGGRTISNGLGWASKDMARYVDSAYARIFSLSGSMKEPGQSRLSTFAELDPGDEPDGLEVSPTGEVFVALWRGARIAHLAPCGSRLADIEVPANFPTSVALGGAKREFMVVTSAAHREPGVPVRDGDGAVFICNQKASGAEKPHG